MAARKRYAVNGIELDVIEAGDPANPAVVLCHGFPESAHSWRHQIEPLAAAGYHVLAPDQRGYGHSSAPRDVAAYGIEHLGGDLLGLLDATGHDDAVFVGHDWGALLVWDLARLHPDRVRAVDQRQRARTPSGRRRRRTCSRRRPATASSTSCTSRRSARPSRRWTPTSSARCARCCGRRPATASRRTPPDAAARRGHRLARRDGRPARRRPSCRRG